MTFDCFRCLNYQPECVPLIENALYLMRISLEEEKSYEVVFGRVGAKVQRKNTSL